MDYSFNMTETYQQLLLTQLLTVFRCIFQPAAASTIECYNCHETGHLARNCPTADPKPIGSAPSSAGRGRGRGRGGRTVFRGQSQAGAAPAVRRQLQRQHGAWVSEVACCAAVSAGGRW